MCLAIPARVVSLHADGSATVTLGGIKKTISLDLVEGIVVGDFVVVHTGFALSRLDPVDAERTLAMLRSAGAPAGAAS